MKRGQVNRRRKLSFFVSALILISILTLSSIPAATVSHTAAQIVGGGTVGAGNYTYPENVIVNGSIGIGTTTPAHCLTIATTANVPSIYLQRGGVQKYGWTMDGNDDLVLGRFSTSDVWQDNVMTVLPTGYIGIGTDTPQQKLNVVGDANVTGTIYAHNYSANSPITFVNSTGGTMMTIGEGGNLNLSGTTVTSAANPTLAGNYSGGYAYQEVYVSGKYAYLAENSPNLQIIDISNPSSPNLIGTYDIGESSSGVYVSGRYAYLLAQSGLKIIDISNPSRPTLTGNYTGGTGSGIYVSGRYAYVTDSSPSLKIIDISNPSSPTLTGNYTSGTGGEVYVSGKYAYMTECFGPPSYYGKNLKIIDISNPSSPNLTGTYFTSSGYGCQQVYVSGRYAYLTDAYVGLQIIDISNSSNPTLTGNYTGSMSEVYVSGKYAYVAEGGNNKGLRIIDISNSSNPTSTGTYAETSGYGYNGVYVSGKYAYMIGENPGLQIIDIKGADIHALAAGNIITNDITVTENVDVGNDLNVRSSVAVGGDLNVNGNLAIRGTLDQSIRINRTAGHFTTTSATFVNVTEANITMTTGAHPVMIWFNSIWQNNETGTYIKLDVTIDGTRLGGTDTLFVQKTVANIPYPIAFIHVTAPLSAGVHTIQIVARTEGGQLLIAAGTDIPYYFGVVELA